MPVVMLVKCEKCGYENFPQHRYCGMCASPLRIPGVPATQPPPAPTGLPPVQHAAPKYEERPATPPKEAALRQVSGPSFLGLGQEPAEDKSFSYLFEDETPSHRGRNVILILLLAAAAAAAIWHWRQDLRVVTDRLLDTLPAAQKPAASNKTDATSPAPAPADSPAGAASSASSSTPSEPTAAVSGTPTQAAQTLPPDAAAGPPAGSGTTSQPRPGRKRKRPVNPGRRVHQVRLLPMRNRKNRTPMKLRARRRMRANLRSRRQHGLRQRHLERTTWRRRARNISMETVSRRTAPAQEQT